MNIYPGCNRPQIHYSMQTVKHINLSLTLSESTLYNTKWWDYRFTDVAKPMHPMDATHLFCHYYIKSVKRAMLTRKDKKDVRKVEVVRRRPGLKDAGYGTNDLLTASQTMINSMWKARQEADKHGIPYDFWCDKAMKYGEMMDWPNLPKPNQLYSKKSKVYGELENFISVVDFVTQSWSEYLETNLMYGKSPHYKVSNMTLPLDKDQRAHQAHLLKILRKTNNKLILLVELVYRADVLIPDIVIKEFEDGKNLLERAKRLAT